MNDEKPAADPDKPEDDSMEWLRNWDQWIHWVFIDAAAVIAVFVLYKIFF